MDPWTIASLNSRKNFSMLKIAINNKLSNSFPPSKMTSDWSNHTYLTRNIKAAKNRWPRKAKTTSHILDRNKEWKAKVLNMTAKLLKEYLCPAKALEAIKLLVLNKLSRPKLREVTPATIKILSTSKPSPPSSRNTNYRALSSELSSSATPKEILILSQSNTPQMALIMWYRSTTGSGKI